MRDTFLYKKLKSKTTLQSLLIGRQYNEINFLIKKSATLHKLDLSKTK